MEENKKSTIKFRDEVFNVADDIDYGYDLELTDLQEKAKEEKWPRAKLLSLMIPIMIKIIIPEADSLFDIDYEKRKFLFKETRLGFCELEELMTDLSKEENLILERRLPHIYKKLEEKKDLDSKEAQEEKNE